MPSLVSLGGTEVRVSFLPPEIEGGVRQIHYTPWIRCLRLYDYSPGFQFSPEYTAPPTSKTDNVWMPGEPFLATFEGEGFGDNVPGYIGHINLVDAFTPTLGVGASSLEYQSRLRRSIIGTNCELKIQATNRTCVGGSLVNAYANGETCVGGTFRVGKGPYSEKVKVGGIEKNLEFKTTLSIGKDIVGFFRCIR